MSVTWSFIAFTVLMSQQWLSPINLAYDPRRPRGWSTQQPVTLIDHASIPAALVMGPTVNQNSKHPEV